MLPGSWKVFSPDSHDPMLKSKIHSCPNCNLKAFVMPASIKVSPSASVQLNSFILASLHRLFEVHVHGLLIVSSLLQRSYEPHWERPKDSVPRYVHAANLAKENQRGRTDGHPCSRTLKSADPSGLTDIGESVRCPACHWYPCCTGHHSSRLQT